MALFDAIGCGEIGAVHDSEFGAFLGLWFEVEYFLDGFELLVVAVDGFSSDDFEFVLTIHLNCL